MNSSPDSWLYKDSVALLSGYHAAKKLPAGPMFEESLLQNLASATRISKVETGSELYISTCHLDRRFAIVSCVARPNGDYAIMRIDTRTEDAEDEIRPLFMTHLKTCQEMCPTIPLSSYYITLDSTKGLMWQSIFTALQRDHPEIHLLADRWKRRPACMIDSSSFLRGLMLFRHLVKGKRVLFWETLDASAIELINRMKTQRVATIPDRALVGDFQCALVCPMNDAVLAALTLLLVEHMHRLDPKLRV